MTPGVSLRSACMTRSSPGVLALIILFASMTASLTAEKTNSFLSLDSLDWITKQERAELPCTFGRSSMRIAGLIGHSTSNGQVALGLDAMTLLSSGMHQQTTAMIEDHFLAGP